MKKAEDYIKNLDFCEEDVTGVGFFVWVDNLNKDELINIIKLAQEDAIRETVEECAENAETIISDNFLIELGKFAKIKAPSNKDYIYKPSILSVAGRLIKEL